MSVWIELRCDKQNEDCAMPVYKGHERSECWANTNDGCGNMALASQTSLLSTYQYICNQAKKEGWRKIKGEWVCPHCINQLQEPAKGD